MLGLWVDRMNGVFQLKRSGSPCLTGLRADAALLAGAEVPPADRAVLALGVDEVGVVRVDAADEAVAAADEDASPR